VRLARGRGGTVRSRLNVIEYVLIVPFKEL
jgi:hypothetical protein